MPTHERQHESDPGDRSSWPLLIRLSAMMLLQYLSLGFWAVTIPTYLAANTGEEGSGLYSEGFAGYVSVAGALGSLLSPILFGLISDRYLSAQRLASVAHFACMVSAWGMYTSESQTTFFLWFVFYFQCFIPTVALANKIALRHLKNIDKEFPRVRVFGTLGWIVAGLFIGVAAPMIFGESVEYRRTPLLFGAGGSLAIALYSLTLPATPPEHKFEGKSSTLSDWFALLDNRPFTVFLVVSVLACVPSMAYMSYANLFLNQSHYPSPAALLTIGQASEVICMWVMPWFIARIALKWLFIVGVLCWAVRYALLALSAMNEWASPVMVAILLHGPCYVFIYVGGQLYIDRLTSPKNRGAAQGMHTTATTGLGHMLGSLYAGYSQETLLTPEGVSPPPYQWVDFWLAPALYSFFTAMLFKYGFRPPKQGKTEPPVIHADDYPPSPVDALTEPHED